MATCTSPSEQATGHGLVAKELAARKSRVPHITVFPGQFPIFVLTLKIIRHSNLIWISRQDPPSQTLSLHQVGAVRVLDLCARVPELA